MIDRGESETQKTEHTSTAQEPQEQTQIDQEIVEQLRKSSKIIKPLTPVIVNQDAKLLSGKHRRLADPKWPTTVVETKDRKEELLITIHSNVQRRVRREETQAHTLELARMLESQGVKKPDISSELAKILPFSDRYIRELLPDEYKHVEKRSRDAELVPHRENGESGLSRQDKPKVSEREEEPPRIFDSAGKLLPSVTEDLVVEACKRGEITVSQLSEAASQLRDRQEEERRKRVKEQLKDARVKGRYRLYEKQKLKEAPDASFECGKCGRTYFVYHLGTRMRDYHKMVKVMD